MEWNWTGEYGYRVKREDLDRFYSIFPNNLSNPIGYDTVYDVIDHSSEYIPVKIYWSMQRRAGINSMFNSINEIQFRTSPRDGGVGIIGFPRTFVLPAENKEGVVYIVLSSWVDISDLILAI